MRKGVAFLIGIVLALALVWRAEQIVQSAASYPTAVKSFTTRLAGQTINAAHVNDLQDEVTAIEEGLLNGLSHNVSLTAASAVLTFSGATAPEILFSAANGNINSNTDLIFEIDKNNDGTEIFEVRNGTSTAMLTLTEAGAGALADDLAVNGDAITSDDTTFNLFNATVTTMNFAGAATALTVGATTGTATLRNAIVDFTGGQLKLPGTQVPSADVNTLDDYEEGSWTPVIGGSGGTSGQVYSVQVGRYVKIGKLVVASFVATLSTEGTITGNVQIQGLPFTVDNVTNGGAVGATRWSLATTWVNVVLKASVNTTVAAVTGAAAAATTNTTALSATDTDLTSSLEGTIMYFASN